jgi:hypothetical protein
MPHRQADLALALRPPSHRSRPTPATTPARHLRCSRTHAVRTVKIANSEPALTPELRSKSRASTRFRHTARILAPVCWHLERAASRRPATKGARAKSPVALLARCETNVVSGAQICIRAGTCTRSQRGRHRAACVRQQSWYERRQGGDRGSSAWEQQRPARSRTRAWRASRPSRRPSRDDCRHGEARPAAQERGRPLHA